MATVNLSERNRYDLFIFLQGTVQPKDRREQRDLKRVWSQFGIKAMQDKVDDAAKVGKPCETCGQSTPAAVAWKDQGDTAEPLEVNVEAIGNLLDYLDKPGANAILGLRLLDISDELIRARDSKEA